MRDVLRALVALMFVATASAYEYSGAVEAMSNGLPHVEVLTAANFSDPPGPRAEAWFVMFYAPWCGHCHRMMPLWEEVASGFGGVDGIDVESSVSVRVAKVDATKNMGVARRYYVEFYPTLVLITNGGQVYKVGREIQRTATALAAYARGGYLETRAEWAILAWRVWKPMHWFIDTIDHFAELAMVHYGPEIREVTSYCQRDGTSVAVCVAVGFGLLVAACIVGICATTCCCTRGLSYEDDDPPPAKKAMKKAPMKSIPAKAAAARTAGPPAAGRAATVVAGAASKGVKQHAKEGGTSSGASREERLRRLQAELAELMAEEVASKADEAGEDEDEDEDEVDEEGDADETASPRARAARGLAGVVRRRPHEAAVADQ